MGLLYNFPLNLVSKEEMKENVAKESGNTRLKLKKNDNEISLDSIGYPKYLLSPPKMLAIEDAKPDTWSKDSGSPCLDKRQRGSHALNSQHLTRKKPGHKYDPPCPKDKSGWALKVKRKGKKKVIKKKKKKINKGVRAALKKPAAAIGQEALAQIKNHQCKESRKVLHCWLLQG